MTRPTVLLVVMAMVVVLSWPGVALAEPRAEGPSEPPGHHEPHVPASGPEGAPEPAGHHEHPAPAPGSEAPKHDDNPEDETSHLPIQVYYHLEFINQPWRAERRQSTYHEMIKQGAVLVLLQGGVLGLLWRRRKA